MRNDRQAAIAALQARRTAHGMSDPLNRLRAYGATQEPITEVPRPLVIGEKLWNGAIVTPQLAAAYNAIQARIAGFRAEGKPAPDQLLNGAHALISGAI